MATKDINNDINAALDKLEAKIDEFSNKASEEIKTTGKVSKETNDAITKLGEQQREQAERLIRIEQAQVKGSGGNHDEVVGDSWGEQVVKSAAYESFQKGSKHLRLEIKAVFGHADLAAGMAPALRLPGIMTPLQRSLLVESLFNAVPTTAYAIEWLRETGFVNNAAETAEKALKPESNLTFDMQNTTIKTVAHWTRITRQLAADLPTLRAYI